VSCVVRSDQDSIADVPHSHNSLMHLLGRLLVCHDMPFLLHPQPLSTSFPISLPHSPTANLPAPTPHILQEPIPLRQTVDAVVALAHGAHEAAQRVRLVLARVSAVLVHLGHRDLHARVVLGFDDAVGRAALAGNITGEKFVSIAFGGWEEWCWRCWDCEGEVARLCGGMRTGRRARRVRFPL